jgi:hypothetical protein
LTALKTPAFQLLNRINADSKIVDIHRLVSMPMANMSYVFYPRLYRISDVVHEDKEFAEIDPETELMIKPDSRALRAKSLSHFESYAIDDG